MAYEYGSHAKVKSNIDSYFNISDGATIAGTEATLFTDQHLLVDSTDIPTGEIGPYPGIKAGESFVLGDKEPDIDLCFVVNSVPSTVALDTRSAPLRKLTAFHHPNTSLHFEVLSTEPAFQFYTGKYINVPAVDGVPARGPRSAFCVEPSRYINAVNEDKWRNMVLLKKGELWGTKIVYQGWKE